MCHNLDSERMFSQNESPKHFCLVCIIQRWLLFTRSRFLTVIPTIDTKLLLLKYSSIGSVAIATSGNVVGGCSSLTSLFDALCHL